MDSTNLVKKDLLRRKIEEYFSKHPKSKSVIFSTNIGESKTLWRVKKKNKAFNIVEVNTTREQFTFEGESPTELNEASPDFANMSKSFMDAMKPPFDHTKLSSALKSINIGIGKLQDPNERNQAGSMLGVLTPLVSSTTRQAGGGSKITIAHKAMPGPSIAEGPAIEIGNKEPKKMKPGEEIPNPKNPKEPKEPKDPVGLETGKGNHDDDQEVEGPGREKSSEEVMLAKSLQGQTIKDASIELTPEGGILRLDLAAVKGSSDIEWKNDGRVVYHFKGRPYFLRRQ